jgi:starch-binding outer membrane protein, SusD/RagB family
MIGETSRRRGTKTICAAVLTVMALAGCDGLLEVELPGSITERDLTTPEMADIWMSSAIGRVECAFDSYITFDDMSDVWWRGLGYQGGMGEYRERPTTTTTCGRSSTTYGWYVPMQVARAENQRLYRALQGWTEQQVPQRERFLAQSSVYAGYTLQLMGEVMCELAVDLGPRLSPLDVQREAEKWFTTSLEHIQRTGDFSTRATQSVRQMALLGRARARFAMNDLEGAAADARQIQPGFAALLLRDNSEHERRNQVFLTTTFTQGTIARPILHPWLDVANRKQIPFTGYYELSSQNDAQGRPLVIPLAIDAQGRNNVGQFPIFRDAPGAVADPRVPVAMTARIIPATTIRQVIQDKYRSYEAPIPLARWAEAQLILAEIEGGQQAIARINALRDVHGLPHFSVPNPSAREIEDLIIEERRREFFFEGRFYGTKIRNNLWFPLGEGQVPTGYRYGPGTCMLMPQIEYDLNPNLQ